MLSPDEDATRMFQRGNSKNQAALRRKLSANIVFQCLISSGPLAVVVDQRARRRTGIALHETLSTHFDTRCALGRARSIRRPAQSIVGPSRSAICKVWCASGRARSISHTATCSRAESRCIASAARSTLSPARSSLRPSQSAHTQTEDTHFAARTAPVVFLSSFFSKANARLSS